MKLSEIKETTPLVKDFYKRFEKSVKEKIVSSVLNKAKRVAGVSAIPIDLNLENGQVVTIYLRIIDDKPDIFRVDVNGRQMPTTGDFSNEYKPSFNLSVDEVASFVRQGQSAFDKKRAKVKVKPISPKRETVSIKQQIQDFKSQSHELDQVISQKQLEKQALVDQLAVLQN